MSDIDDDLLGLLDDDEDVPVQTKRPGSPRHDAPAKKRRKGRAGSESDMDTSDASSDFEAPSSALRRTAPRKKDLDFDDDEDDEDAVEQATPETQYPYRGLYKSREEYKELHEMNELEREAIIGTRQEEIQAFKDRQKLRQLLANREGNIEGGRGERKKTQTGRTDAKASALEKLRRTRKSKAARAAEADDAEYGTTTRRSKARDYSDEEYTSEEEETARGKKGRKKEQKAVERAGRTELAEITLERWRFARTWHMPWFEEYVKGAWVRVSLGPNQHDGSLVYNFCEVVGVDEPNSRPYMVEKEITDVTLRLKFGGTERIFTLNQLSGRSEVTPQEYSRLQNRLDADGLSLPTMRDFELKKGTIDKYKHMQTTEEDLAYSLKKKAELRQKYGPQGLKAAELLGRREMAKQDGDLDAIKSIDIELVSLQQEMAHSRLSAGRDAAKGSNMAGSSPVKAPDTPRDALAAVNERNRLANRQAVRKAELAGRTAAKASAESAVHDPSARVKTTVRMLHDVSASGSQNASRAATPAPEEAKSTPSSAVKPVNGSTGTGPGVRLEQAIASKVSVDLGDF